MTIDSNTSPEKKVLTEDYSLRIEELETKLTFQDHLIEELNQALIEQQGDLRRLTRIVENVVSQVEQIGDASSNGNAVELPPHY